MIDHLRLREVMDGDYSRSNSQGAIDTCWALAILILFHAGYQVAQYIDARIGFSAPIEILCILADVLRATSRHFRLQSWRIHGCGVQGCG